ncbi:MotA/TolQ/ExbB proton channel family protein [Nitrosomonas sp. Is37]|uniref:MotA/TolQ/ExbB proton channel family protein n=1 Tax=Nitrosomonas sp. Is37 TaxID=3080535 RepID=UPI00294B9412|nr:MotA/TolQ/ExbB proton channel family protein [Nitrosomonas sp. Is37]MDV6344654.1 MotA/TolQ/ExbB proton channel family protein [Nitrosomonas sp. Is37]
MKKVLFLSLLLIVLGNSVHAAEDKNAASSQATVASEPEVKQGSSSDQSKQQKKSAAKQEIINLETAYKREYAFLEAQKRELTERLKSYQSSASNEEKTLINKISALERSSVERSAKIDQLNAKLADAERKEAAVTERNDALETTYMQAESTLKNHSIELPSSIKEDKGNDPAKVSYLFKQALSLINSLGATQVKPGSFFLEDGKQTKGSIIQVGNIAAYGVSDDGSGSLAPAGGGDFKIWKSAGAESAVALSKNQQPDTLQLFLFESRTTAVDEMPEQTLLEHVDSGGAIGWVIVILGLIGGLFVLIRIYLLHTNSTNVKQLSDQIMHHLADGNLDVAKKSCEENSSAIGRVLLYTLRHLKDDRDHMEGIVYEATLQETGPLDRFGSAILVIASLSPLLGLLGTITGMIETFDSITQFGTSDPRLLSEGISIALVTTELGLVVAIPTLLLGTLLSTWARNIKRDMEHSALKILNAFLGGGLDLEEAAAPVVNDNTLLLKNS